MNFYDLILALYLILVSSLCGAFFVIRALVSWEERRELERSWWL